MNTKAIFTSLLTLLILPQFFLGAPEASAENRNCTAEEKAFANEQLMTIQNDMARQETIIKRHLPFGLSVGNHESQGGVDNEVLLVHEGYVLLHDNDLRTGLWVSYRLTSEDISGAEGKDRVNCFRSDPRLAGEDGAKLSDFDEPIYDRGHLANDADLKDNLTEQINTYVLSNMSPQHCRLNRGIWLSLEHLGRAWAKKYGTVFITSGAVFDFNNRDDRDKDSKAGRMGSRNQKGRVAVPSDYYKIFLRKEGNTWHSITFLLENNNAKNGVKWETVLPKVEASIEPIETIEQKTEVAFLPDLDRNDLVQSLDGSNWDLSIGKNNFEAGCN